ncbi:MAG: phosphoribosylformylglycinamidine synthase I [Endomicrobiia bacterium]
MKIKNSTKALVLRAPGTNCDLETLRALELVGFETFSAHINELINKSLKLDTYNLLVIPGGFSFGDYISAGKIFAVEIVYKLKSEIEKFVFDSNKFVVGICNGFQVLVKMGLLPEPTFKQQCTLIENDSGKFECRWVHLKVNKNNPSPLRNLPSIIQLPIAHAEGKFVAKEDVITKLFSNNQVLFQYCDLNGNLSNFFPVNPNGSIKNIAGITNDKGNIIGLMPHPERFVLKQQHPSWRNCDDIIIPFGKLFFENIRKSL